MRYLTLGEVLELHRQVMETSGGISGLRGLGGLESAVVQPRMSFGEADLYPALEEKAAALCYSPIRNHPFTDGNKRVGHASMEVFLELNGYEIQASVDEQEPLILGIASGDVRREDLVSWVKDHLVQIGEAG